MSGHNHKSLIGNRIVELFQVTSESLGLKITTKVKVATRITMSVQVIAGSYSELLRETDLTYTSSKSQCCFQIILVKYDLP